VSRDRAERGRYGNERTGTEAHGAPFASPGHTEWPVDTPPPPGQAAVVGAGLAIGLLLMGVQLWLLTVALDLYLAGAGYQVWSLALVSGLIFLGGLLVLWQLGKRPRVAYPWPSESGRAGEPAASGSPPPGGTR
jgi:hypothetical protein